MWFKRKRQERVELWKDEDGWRYHVVAGNSEITMSSEQGFANKSYALKRARKQFPTLEVFLVSDGELVLIEKTV